MPTVAAAQNGVQVLRVDGDLVAATVPQFRRLVEGLLARDERDYVIDLGDVRGVDSAGLEALTWLHARCEERLGSIKLCRMPPTVSAILRLTRLDGRFEQFATVDDATAAVG